MENKMKMVRSILGFILTATISFACICTSADAADKAPLKLKLEKGVCYIFDFTTDQDISQTIQGQKHEMQQSMGFKYELLVQDIDKEKNYIIKNTYTHASFFQNGPMGKIEYDSSKPSKKVHPMAKGFAGLINQSFIIKMSEKGKVVDVTGVDKMMDKILKEMEFPTEAARKMTEKTMKKQFSDEALKNQMENLFLQYPEKPVGPGDKWTNSISLTGGFPMNIESAYTLKNFQGDTAFIDIRSTISPNRSAEGLKMGNMTMKYNIQGVQTGTMEVNRNTGLTTSSNLEQKLAGKIEIKGQGSQDTSWPIKIISEVVLTCKKK